MGSDEYVRTHRAIIRRVVTLILQAVQDEDAYRLTDEAEAFETVRTKLIKKGVSPDLAELECAEAKEKAKIVLKLVGSNSRPTASESSRSAVEDKQELDKAHKEQEKEEEEEGKALYVVSVARRKNSSCTVACLHSRSGCYRGRGLVFANYELIHEHPPPPNDYNHVCKTCWPVGLAIDESDDELAATSSSISTASPSSGEPGT